MSGTIFIETGFPATPGANGIRITINDSMGIRVGTEVMSAADTQLRGLNFVYNATNPFVGALFTNLLGVFQVKQGTSRTLNGSPAPPIQGATAAVPLTPDTCYEITWSEVSGFISYGLNHPSRFYFNMQKPFVAGNLTPYTGNPTFGRLLSATDGYESNQTVSPTVPVPAYIYFSNDGPYDPMNPNPPIDYFPSPCCVAANTIMQTSRGPIPASEVQLGDYLFREDGSAVQVLRNVRFSLPSSDFYKLGQPGGEFLIKGDHPILENGQEIPAKQSNNAMFVMSSTPLAVHTFITEKRDFVNISGVSVGTWSLEAFDNFLQQDARGRRMQIDN